MNNYAGKLAYWGEAATSPGKENTMLRFITTAILLTILITCIHQIVNVMIPDVRKMCKNYLKSDKELERAVKEQRIAEQNLNYAEKEFVDTAIYGLKAADEKVNSLIKVEKVG